DEAAPSEPSATPIEPEARGEDSPPPHFFRAAGDPEEPDPEPDTSLGARVGAQASQLQKQIKPAFAAVLERAREFAGWTFGHAKQIKKPRSMRDFAVWAGWTAAGFTALIIGLFVFITWDMPSTDDLWEAKNGQSITFLDRNGHVILREGAQ